MSQSRSAKRRSELDAPRHDEMSWLTRAWELTCILAAAGLLVLLVVRVAPFVWQAPAWLLLAVAGAFAADFTSGIVHWTADTWGSEAMPLLGRRFVRPFRVHHVNPDDFLRRDMIDCNGDVAALNLPFLAFGIWAATQSTWGGAIAVFCCGFCGAGLPTNQAHQWAHMRSPPRVVRWLQRMGVILRRPAHARHHCPPYVANYCIATGWCNPLLAAIGFFPRLERAVTWLTGLQPRADDHAFASAVSQRTAASVTRSASPSITRSASPSITRSASEEEPSPNRTTARRSTTASAAEPQQPKTDAAKKRGKSARAKRRPEGGVGPSSLALRVTVDE